MEKEEFEEMKITLIDLEDVITTSSSYSGSSGNYGGSAWEDDDEVTGKFGD